MNCEEILERLEGVQSSGSGHIARCPAHDDRKPSLSVQEKDDRILIKCHAGCSTQDVLKSIGCDMRDLFCHETRRAKSRPRKSSVQPIAESEIALMQQRLGSQERDYLCRERLLSNKVIDHYRLGLAEKNRNRQITIPIFDDAGLVRDVRLWLRPELRNEGSSKITHWAKGYGAPRLYPIDQLSHDDLVVVEGELDALALISHGVPAITVTAGATTWPDDLSRHFEGKNITISMDNDGAGCSGAEGRAESLSKYAAKVCIASWPPDRPKGWDVTDELKEYGIDRVRSMLDTADEWIAEEDEVDAADCINSFPIDALAEPLRRLCVEGAAAIQCPIDYIAVSSLVIAGSAIGRSRCLQLKRGWDEYGGLYAAIVADPGAAKSPALMQAADPLMKRAQSLFEVFQSRLEEYEAAQRQWQKNPEKHSRPDKPTMERVYVSDITVESLAKVLDENPRGILIYRDELSAWAQAMNAYKGGKGSDRQFYLSMWSGTPSPVDRKNQDRPLFLAHPFLGIIGTIQTDTLQALLHEARWDDGLMDRILFTYPDFIVPDSWSDEEIASATMEDVGQLYNQLYELDVDEETSKVVMTDEAHVHWKKWYAFNQQELMEGQDHLKGVWSKMSAQCSRLILITHLTRWAAGEVDDPDRVDVASVVAGTLLAEYFKSHARRIYSVISESDGDRRLRKVVNWIRRRDRDGVTARDLQRSKVAGINKAAEARKILDQLQEKGQGSWASPARRISGQRGASKFYLTDGSTLDQMSHLVVAKEESVSSSRECVESTRQTVE